MQVSPSAFKSRRLILRFSFYDHGSCVLQDKKSVVFELPSEIEQKGFSIASKAVLDNTKLRTLGFSPKYEIKDAIIRTIEILKN